MATCGKLDRRHDDLCAGELRKRARETLRPASGWRGRILIFGLPATNDYVHKKAAQRDRTTVRLFSLKEVGAPGGGPWVLCRRRPWRLFWALSHGLLL